jgi:hypothetical protein
MKQQSITTLPPSPEEERRSRMIKYTIAMSIRVACIVALLFAQGWWLVVFAAGAIFLPYIAVVLANVSGPTRSTQVLRPGGLVPSTPAVSDGGGEPAAGPGSDDAGADVHADPDVETNADADADPHADQPPGDERGAA